MANDLESILCFRCKKAGKVTVHTIFRSAVWFQDEACGHIFEVKKEELNKLGITESEVAKHNASIARDL